MSVAHAWLRNRVCVCAHDLDCQSVEQAIHTQVDHGKVAAHVAQVVNVVKRAKLQIPGRSISASKHSGNCYLN